MQGGCSCCIVVNGSHFVGTKYLNMSKVLIAIRTAFHFTARDSVLGSWVPGFKSGRCVVGGTGQGRHGKCRYSKDRFGDKLLILV
jgi:hypothetical protein